MPLAAQNYCCSQILLLLALRAQGVENWPLVRAASGVCHGMGASGLTCGILTGGCLAIGLYVGRGREEELAHDRADLLVTEYVDWFRDRVIPDYGDITCQAVLGEGKPDMPGATPKEVENRVVGPMERILWEIPGVEYVYSTASDGEALTVVRFRVGADVEKSVVATYARLYQHLDWIPPGCSRPIVKPRSIDDVPVLVVALWGGPYESRQLRTLAAAVNEEVRRIPGVGETTVTGGRRRAVMVELNPDRLRAQGLDAVDVLDALDVQNKGQTLGEAFQSGRTVSIRLDNFFRSERELSRAVVAVQSGRPVYLADVATVRDGFDEPGDYVFFLPGRGVVGEGAAPGGAYPAVTLSVAKRAGENASRLADAALRRIKGLRGVILPGDLHVTVTRNYGDTARQKVNELLEHLLLAAVTVGGVVALFLGFRASLVVMISQYYPVLSRKKSGKCRGMLVSF